MKKLNVILLMLAAGALTASAQTPCGQDAGQRTDSLKIKTNNRRMTALRTLNTDVNDSTRNKLKVYNVDRNAVKTPKYDAFKEKMKKEPLAGDLLKDVIGNVIR